MYIEEMSREVRRINTLRERLATCVTESGKSLVKRAIARHTGNLAYAAEWYDSRVGKPQFVTACKRREYMRKEKNMMRGNNVQF